MAGERSSKEERDALVTEMSQVVNALGYVLDTSKISPNAIVDEFRPEFQAYFQDLSCNKRKVWEVRQDFQSIFVAGHRTPVHYTDAAQIHLLPIMDELLGVTQPKPSQR